MLRIEELSRSEAGRRVGSHPSEGVRPHRSELFTRQGHSPGVEFPRVLGIEAVGAVEEAPGGEFHGVRPWQPPWAGMGRAFDGGYAEYTCVPAGQVQALDTTPGLADLRSTARDDPNRLGFAQQLAEARGRAIIAHSGRDHLGGLGGCAARQETGCHGGGHHPKSRSRSHAEGQRRGSCLHRRR